MRNCNNHLSTECGEERCGETWLWDTLKFPAAAFKGKARAFTVALCAAGEEEEKAGGGGGRPTRLAACKRGAAQAATPPRPPPPPSLLRRGTKPHGGGGSATGKRHPTPPPLHRHRHSTDTDPRGCGPHVRAGKMSAGAGLTPCWRRRARAASPRAGGRARARGRWNVGRARPPPARRRFVRGGRGGGDEERRENGEEKKKKKMSAGEKFNPFVAGAGFF